MRYFSIVFLFFLFATTSNAQRIGYVDQAAAIKDAADVKTAEAELKKIVQSWRDTLGMLQRNYEAKLAEFKLDSARLAPDSFRIRKTELINMQAQGLQYERLKINNRTGGDYLAHRNRLLEPIRKHFREVVAEVAKKEKVDIVLPKDKLVLAPDAIDLTPQVAAKLK